MVVRSNVEVDIKEVDTVTYTVEVDGIPKAFIYRDPFNYNMWKAIDKDGTQIGNLDTYRNDLFDIVKTFVEG